MLGWIWTNIHPSRAKLLFVNFSEAFGTFRKLWVGYDSVVLFIFTIDTLQRFFVWYLVIVAGLQWSVLDNPVAQPCFGRTTFKLLTSHLDGDVALW